MKPRKNYRMRPKKSGAKKRQKLLSQKRRLAAAGYEKESLDKMTSVQIRDLLKVAGKKKTAKTKKTSVKKVKAEKKVTRTKPKPKAK